MHRECEQHSQAARPLDEQADAYEHLAESD